MRRVRMPQRTGLAVALLLSAALVSPSAASKGVYDWNNRAATRAKTQEMIDWAEGRGAAAASPAEADGQATSLLQENAKATAHHSRSAAMLNAWRSRHAAIQDAEARRNQFQQQAAEHVARLQMQLARKHNEGTSLLEVEEEMRRAGGEQTLFSTQRVANSISRVARAARMAAKHANGEDKVEQSITKFLESQSFVDGADEAAMAGSGVPASANVQRLAEQYDPIGAAQASEPSVPHDDVQAEDLAARAPVDAVDAALQRVQRAPWAQRAQQQQQQRTQQAAATDGMRFRGGAEQQFLFGGGSTSSSSSGDGSDGPLNVQGKDARCAMCVYYMEMLEKEIGFPTRTQWSDSYPSYSGVTDYAGPGAYFKGVTGRTPPVDNMADPVPGPGFVYSFLQQLERADGPQRAQQRAAIGRKLLSALRATAKVQAQHPVDPWRQPGDYANFMSEADNLRERLTQVREVEPTEAAAYRQEIAAPAVPLEEQYASMQRRGGNAEAPDFAQQQQQFEQQQQQEQQLQQRQQQQLTTGGLDDQRKAAEAWLRSNPLQRPERQVLGAVAQAAAEPTPVLLEAQGQAQATPASTTYTPEHDPFLGMRPEDRADQAQTAQAVGEVASDATEFLETQTQVQVEAQAEVQVEAQAERVGQQGILDTLKGGFNQIMGQGTCREGMAFCRVPQKHDGRRALERRARIQTRDAEFARTRAMMEEALRNVCQDAPKRFYSHCVSVLTELDTVVDMYLHDYDDEEICADIGMCAAKDLGIPSKPRVLPA